MILAILTYKSPKYFLSSFESIGLFVQEKQFKIDFHDGNCGGHLGFPIRTVKLSSIYKSPRYFLSNFESTDISVQEKNYNVYFQDGGHCDHLGFPIEIF